MKMFDITGRRTGDSEEAAYIFIAGEYDAEEACRGTGGNIVPRGLYRYVPRRGYELMDADGVCAVFRIAVQLGEDMHGL